jgi:anti-sigma factor RsiW
MSHVDLDQVADLDGGVLSPEQERAVRGHLETCDECSHLLERVREVHDLLTAEPTSPIPATVAARIDESLAAAARDREARTRVVSLDRARRRRHVWTSRLLAAAVGLAVVGGGAYVAQNVLGSNGSSDNATSQEAAAGGQTARAGPAAPNEAIGPILNLHLRGHDLRTQLRTALTAKPSAFDSFQADTTAGSGSQLVAPSCVSSALADQEPASWASYRVTFDSRPAVLVLSSAGTARVKVWVVECQPSPIVSASTILSNP